MLSGDWISSELYNRVAAINSTCRFIGMGGATEASIGSNWYEIKSKEDLRSNYIPYGFALNNQAYRIINSDLLDCPHYVTGELLDSLKAIKLSSEINKTFNLEFTTMELLETQTLGELFNKIYPLISYKGESK